MKVLISGVQQGDECVTPLIFLPPCAVEFAGGFICPLKHVGGGGCNDLFTVADPTWHEMPNDTL
jgi:hypothetical protein